MEQQQVSLQPSVGPGGAAKGAGFWLALASPSQSATQGLTPPPLPVLTTADVNADSLFVWHRLLMDSVVVVISSNDIYPRHHRGIV